MVIMAAQQINGLCFSITIRNMPRGFPVIDTYFGSTMINPLDDRCRCIADD